MLSDPERAREQARGLLALAAVPPSTAVSVERVDESNRDRLRALLESSIAPGAHIDDVLVNEAAEMVTFEAGDGHRATISLALASALD